VNYLLRLTRGPITLIIVGLLVTVAGYGGYRVVRYVSGWGAAPAKSELLQIEIDDATLRRVDVSDSKVELTSDLLGVFGATLVVTPTTQIQLDGTPAQLKDLPEGARVRAAYEWRDGFKIARSISADAPSKGPIAR
jgi:hypothetical protein